LDKNQIDVSVILLTYNQEAYVNQSLDSIFNQKFSGTWEVIIADDSSSDNTAEIIKSNNRTLNSHLIDFYSNEVNLGLSRNYEKAINKAKGKYIAYLEGDDYWTDPYKLQKQFDFLESHPNYVLVFHDFIIVDKEGSIISDKNLKNSVLMMDRSKKDMTTGCLIHQNTIMFRNVIDKFPLGFFKAKNHDTFLIAYLSNWGEAGYVNCDPLHYRLTENSLWSSLSEEKKHINGLITYLWIFSIATPQTYLALLTKVFSKIKSIILIKFI
jgi:glycosyltransferase involved in cell wall biosynthesis